MKERENRYPYHIRDVHISDPFIFADSDYWAPELHLWKGRYYLISSFRAPGRYRGCQCLVSDSPRGPFLPVGDGPVTPKGWHCLDGTLYVDRHDKPWMVFCHEWLQVYDGQICAIPLNEELSGAIGDPVILFRASDGPFLYRLKSGVLLMLWSSFSPGGGYTTGYARSLSGEIQGPWVQHPQPLYALDGAHSMLFCTFGGELMMSLHCPNRHADKRILLFEMEESLDGLHIVNEATGNWYHAVGGVAKDYAYPTPCVEEPCFRVDPRAGKEGGAEERKG